MTIDLSFDDGPPLLLERPGERHEFTFTNPNGDYNVILATIGAVRFDVYGIARCELAGCELLEAGNLYDKQGSD